MCGRNVVFYQLWLSLSWPSSGHLRSPELSHYDPVSQLTLVLLNESDTRGQDNQPCKTQILQVLTTHNRDTIEETSDQEQLIYQQSVY